MTDTNQGDGGNPPPPMDVGDSNNLENIGTEEVKTEIRPGATIRPIGIIQMFSDNTHDVIEGTVYNATWKGNVPPPFLCARNRGSGNAGAGLGYRFPSASPPPPPSNPKSGLTFDDCGGLTKQINFLETAVLNTLTSKNKSSLLEQRFKLEPPKGILFYGPPGTGKTRLAQALGNEVSKKLGSAVHFIYRKGQDIASKYFGQSSANLRAVFNEAKKMKHCILFFDELDGLCPTRDNAHLNQANVTIVTTMLGLMDELPRGQVFVIAATNRIDAIDPALRRPGRFDKYLEFLPPVKEGRLKILKIHTGKWKAQPNGDLLKKVSGQTVGYTGADLSKLCLDAFDEALTRRVATHTGRIKDLDLSNLEVKQNDWDNAMRKMKPSNLAIFGSTLYTPSARFGNDLDVLIREDCVKIEAMLVNCFERKTNKDLSICSVYVHTATEGSVLSNIDDVIIPKVLRSSKLGAHPVYTISPKILSSEANTNWTTKISSAFRQALGASDAILYIADVQELWDTVKSFSQALNLKGQLERLRGSSVLVLATAPIPASQLSPDNPFKGLLSGTDNCFEIECPSADKRFEYFAILFGSFLMNDAWPNGDDIITLEEALDNAVESTKEKNIGAIAQLHDMILESYVRKVGNGNREEILRSLFEVTAIYKNILQ